MIEFQNYHFVFLEKSLGASPYFVKDEIVKNYYKVTMLPSFFAIIT
ncbi:hypothetical protein F7308_1141 [Francisella salina]|uniref:Uncharacterized protein n=1 Tax=Francisella salina TaxID=573569 RepID=A0ABM5MAH9_FRAST|nr:hypothetical protein F7308_1141 [Francisella salina]